VFDIVLCLVEILQGCTLVWIPADILDDVAFQEAQLVCFDELDGLDLEAGVVWLVGDIREIFQMLLYVAIGRIPTILSEAF
jgi:hypothetical protein